MTATSEQNDRQQRQTNQNLRGSGKPAAIVLFLAGIVSAGAQPIKPFYQSAQFSVSANEVVEGPYRARAVSPIEVVSNYPLNKNATAQERRWKLHTNLSAFPALRSNFPLIDAIYNLSLEELTQDISREGTFDAGALWPGVWTRDTSYSTLLSLAAIAPQTAEKSLLRKVKRNRIVQDTGTGGSWPVSSDRVCWALAAWEVYLVTGDRQWLEQSSTILKNSIRDDEQVVIDPATGLAHGETSFLDWREQTYPRWMQPADIYSGEALSTNAVYYRVYRILGAMDRALGKNDSAWDVKAERIRSAINQRMWIESQGRYGQYLYGRIWQSLSPRADALGESLAVLFEIPSAAQRASLIKVQPVMPYGIPTVYPETPDISPYHNRSVWPFVQAFWNLAAAKQDDEPALLDGLAAMYRATALFLTNKENFVAENGSPIGTAVNSDRQLWSVAGSLAMVYRVFFGMDFTEDGLHLHPVVPEALSGSRRLTNFHYRGAVLSITVHGFGGMVRSMTIDGERTEPIVPADLRGHHAIVIEMDNRSGPSSPVHLVQSVTAPETPKSRLTNDTLSWEPVQGAARYEIYRDGSPQSTIDTTSLQVQPASVLQELQVAARSLDGMESFLSEPTSSGGQPITIPAISAAGIPGVQTFATLEQSGVTGLSLTGEVPADGRYAIAFRYANGSGPVKTGSRCAIRTLFIDGQRIGPIVLPQRGANAWDQWGMSSVQTISLRKGKHTIQLRFLPADINMDGVVNTVRIQSAQLQRID